VRYALALLAACGGAAPADYVAPSTCASCHPDEAARWRGSHHDRALEVAAPGTLVGGERASYTIGVEPLQQYLVERPGGRFDVHPLAWDTERATWFRFTPEDLPHRYQVWNTMCADCHSTGVAKHYDADADRFATTFEDIDVGCQACHGPGSRHAADPRQPLPAAGDAEACAPCHSRRAAIADRDGATLLDRYRPMTLQAGLYYPDGQILDEVFEYGSFAQSAMHERGVRCTDCHDAHTGKVPQSNAACTQCHNAAPPARFPGLAQRPSNVDSPAHHHHKPGSPGAQCVACHMPERTYMGIDRRRDHSLRVPRPDLAVSLGVPEPCTQACHTDRDAPWAAATVAAWFPAPKPRHFGEVFARARRGEVVPDELRAIATDRDRPAIVRASAFELLAATPEACAAAAVALGLRDPSALVRSTAVACGDGLAPDKRVALAADALDDPVRVVRIEAARILAGVPLPPARRAAFAAARRELEDAYRLDLDRPEGWFNLGTLAEAEHRSADATASYRRALALDPDYKPAQANLAAP
jgi:hypothetical protein